jgi:hypothetical protein
MTITPPGWLVGSKADARCALISKYHREDDNDDRRGKDLWDCWVAPHWILHFLGARANH